MQEIAFTDQDGDQMTCEIASGLSSPTLLLRVKQELGWKSIYLNLQHATEILEFLTKFVNRSGLHK